MLNAYIRYVKIVSTVRKQYCSNTLGDIKRILMYAIGYSERLSLSLPLSLSRSLSLSLSLSRSLALSLVSLSLSVMEDLRLRQSGHKHTITSIFRIVIIYFLCWNGFDLLLIYPLKHTIKTMKVCFFFCPRALNVLNSFFFQAEITRVILLSMKWDWHRERVLTFIFLEYFKVMSTTAA